MKNNQNNNFDVEAIYIEQDNGDCKNNNSKIIAKFMKSVFKFPKCFHV